MLKQANIAKPNYILKLLIAMSIIIVFFSIWFLVKTTNADAYSDNPSPKGECTWWVWERWPEECGRLPEGSTYNLPGHAYQWIQIAQMAGWPTGTTPKVGAVAVWDEFILPPVGHVAYVENVAGDGSFRVSEANAGCGPDHFWHLGVCIQYRWVSPNSHIRFIYPKNGCGNPQTGTLTIDTSPVKGEVFVDGVSWGAAPQSRQVSPGNHTVSFGNVPGYKTPASQTVTVGAGATVNVSGQYSDLAPLFFVKTKNTSSGKVEMHSATQASAYQSGIASATRFSPADVGNGFFQVVGNDLFFIKVRNTSSGKVEIHSASQASGYASGISSATRFSPADAGNGFFQVVGNDLLFIKVRNTSSGKVEIHSASAASAYASGISSATRFTPGDMANGFLQIIGNDLFFVKLRNTGSGKVEIHSASQASGYKSGISSATRFISAEVNSGYFQVIGSDLYLVKLRNTGSNKVEVHSASAGSAYASGVSAGTRFSPADQGNGFFQLYGSELTPGNGREGAVNYYFTWYDNKNASNWILIANPSFAYASATVGIQVAGATQGIGGFAGTSPGVVPQGSVLANIYPGLIGGPVTVGASSSAVVSQRVLWGDSLEEVVGIEDSRLSDHYYWPWYDQLSPGYMNWVLIANPGSSQVDYEIKIAGKSVKTGKIDPGKSVTPSFPGRMGGPVEVKASGKVIASQRVLSSYNRDFTEVPGIPAGELSDHYLWTWYDNQSAGATDWVLVANPNDSEVTYDIKLAGNTVASGSLAPGEKAVPTFPGKMGGPLEVEASGPVIASQRVVFGGSFDELAGYPYDSLKKSYAWTWYDQVSRGSKNWVLIANPSQTETVTYEVKITGNPVASGSLAPGEKTTPTFPGTMNGPVEVTASGKVIASQRVLWNGYFNEVVGS